jgi:hypothetical protein
MDQPLPTTLVALPPPARPAPARPEGFHVGGLIVRTFRVWWQNALRFSLLGILAYAPLGLAMVGFFRLAFAASPPAAPPSPDDLPGFGVGLLLAWLATILLMIVQAGAITHASFQQLRGNRIGLGQAIGAGFRRGLPVVGTGLLMGLGTMVGMLLLVVPGIVLAVAWCTAIPAVVVERMGPVAALRRSFALTRGQRWAVFAGFLALHAILYVAMLVVQIPAVFVAVATAASSPGTGVLVTVTVSQVLGAVFGSVILVGAAVAYHDLRTTKEGPDTEQLAAVFE